MQTVLLNFHLFWLHYRSRERRYLISTESVLYLYAMIVPEQPKLTPNLVQNKDAILPVKEISL